jgi:hypothetical protein
MSEDVRFYELCIDFIGTKNAVQRTENISGKICFFAFCFSESIFGIRNGFIQSRFVSFKFFVNFCALFQCFEAFFFVRLSAC